MADLRSKLLDLLAKGAPDPDYSDLLTRPVFLLAPDHTWESCSRKE